jgi:hypothetical protein
MTMIGMRMFKTMMLTLLLPVMLNGQESTYLPGEKVNFEIHYGVVQGGVASLEIKADTFRGRDVYHSIFTGKTTGMIDAVFKVMDIYESYIEPGSGLCIFSRRNIREGRYRKFNEVIFDHYSRPDSSILTSDLSGVHVVEKNIHDIISCFYYFREHYLPDFKNFKRGDLITINTWFTDELYPIRLKYLGTDEIRTKVGRLKCLKFNPVTEVGRLFKTEDDVSFWFTADKNFLPVKVRFDIFVGSFVAEISSYEGLKYPLEIRRKENN